MAVAGTTPRRPTRLREATASRRSGPQCQQDQNAAVLRYYGSRRTASVRQNYPADGYNYRELAVRRIQALKASVVTPRSQLTQLGDSVTPADRDLFDISRTSDWNLQYFRASETATGDPGWTSYACSPPSTDG